MMCRNRLVLAVMLCVPALLLATACTSSPTSSTPTGPGNQTGELVTPRKGGQAVYAIAAINARLDPAIQLAYSFSPAPVMNAIYGNLMYEVTGSQKITMGFLKSFTTSDNGTTWTAVLRPGLKFSDGTAFDAAAIAYNIQRDADPTIGSPFVNVAKSLKLKVVDATTLEITLSRQNLAFESIFLTDFSYIGSPTAMKAEGTNFGTKPVGAGPFMVRSGVAGQSLTLVRNPYYELYAPGQPYLDKLTFQMIPDYPHQVAALGAGQAQLAYATGQNGVNQLKSAPNINFLPFQTGGGQGFIFNTQKPPFDDVRAREAITYAVDRTKMGPAIAAGTPHAQNLFTPDSPFYDKKFDFPMQDKDRAQRLFDELAADGKPLNFTFIEFAAFPDAVNAANLLVAELSKYRNVKITLKGETSPQALSDIHSHNFEMGSDGLYISNPVPDVTEYFRTGGSTNYSGWSNPKVDAAVQQLEQTTDPAKQKEAWTTIQQEFLSQYPFYFAASGHIGFASSNKLVNVQTIGYGQVPLYGQIGYKQ
jgi:ABC-type transport system substrate-binding protein